MPFVKIAYDPDVSKIGDTVEVSDEQAAEMVHTGRGRITRKPVPPAKKAARKNGSRKALQEPHAGEGTTPEPTDTSMVVPDATDV